MRLSPDVWMQRVKSLEAWLLKHYPAVQPLTKIVFADKGVVHRDSGKDMPHIRGFYNPKTRVVSVVLRTHHGLTPEYVLAHEYVHHLQYNRQMPMKLPRAHIRGHEKDYKAMKRMDADDREIVAIIMGSALVRQYHREVR